MKKKTSNYIIENVPLCLRYCGGVAVFFTIAVFFFVDHLIPPGTAKSTRPPNQKVDKHVLGRPAVFFWE